MKIEKVLMHTNSTHDVVFHNFMAIFIAFVAQWLTHLPHKQAAECLTQALGIFSAIGTEGGVNFLFKRYSMVHCDKTNRTF